MDPHGVTPVENGGSSESSPEGSPLPPPPNTPIKTEFPMNSTGSSSISESSTTPPITLLAAGPSWHSTSQDLPDEGKWIEKRIGNDSISLSHTYERKRSGIFLTWIYNFLGWCYYLILNGASQNFWGLPAELLPHSSFHYLSYTKISQTKCYKQSDTIFQFSFHCSFRCCAPFCSLCYPKRPLLLIGGKLSTANQDPPKEWF